MSARAAWRLELLGFDRVYRYQPGKMDWMAHDLPIDGTEANVPRSGDLARHDLPTCGPDDRMGDIASRVKAEGWDACAVVNAEHVVLGLLRGAELSADPEMIAARVMEPGPKTYRPYASLQTAAGYMDQHGLNGVLITDSDGRLIGMLRRVDVQWPQGDLPPVETSAAGSA